MSVEPREHRIRVRRSARWYELGDATAAATEIWLVVHGYGQLARDFIRSFEPLADEHRIIVAPEALSRFYASVERGGTHREARVGAAWMTREDRDAEILDYVDYLDAVAGRARAAVPAAERLVALGFSQGTATVSRWAAFGTTAPDRLILWGGGPAEDLPARALAERVRVIELVHGVHDQVVPLAVVERAAERMRQEGGAVTMRSFEGGHRIDPGTLIEVARGTG